MAHWVFEMCVAALVVLFIVPAAFAQGNATSDPCVFGVGGKYFDLRPVQQDFTIAQQASTDYKITFNPCMFVATPESGGYCPTGETRACQITSTTGVAYRSAADNIVLTTMSYDGTTLSINYNGGDVCTNQPGTPSRQITVKYTCGTTVGTPSSAVESPSCAYTITWATSAGCALATNPVGDVGSGGGGLSGGDVFLIIFFCGGFLYVVIGMAYNFKFRELRGVEMVPNVDFWRGLPSLIKDGSIFTWQKVTSPCRKD